MSPSFNILTYWSQNALNFFQSFIDIADGAEDHCGHDNIDAVVRDTFHIFSESDDETIQLDLRVIDLFGEELVPEMPIDFDHR